jgi:6,7-dimethyl-8-ribityllumazine synthase
MARRIRGELSARGRSFAIVAGEFNRPLTERLVDGAIECLTRHGADDDAIEVVYVPGSFELPQMVARLAGGRHHAIIALSVLIRGETPHFDLIARTVTGDLSRLGVERGVPVAFGVVTADTIEQAEVRCGVKTSGKGWEAAMAAIAMADVVEKLEA